MNHELEAFIVALDEITSIAIKGDSPKAEKKMRAIASKVSSSKEEMEKMLLISRRVADICKRAG